ncbi:MAG: MarR family winged helix-turn-helix transcriptional regulator [Candidatus Saccharibacteria bacterium]
MSERHIGLIMRLINTEYLKLLDARVKPFGITASQGEALYGISEDEGLSQSQLKNSLGISAASLSVLIDSLSAKQLVERRPDPKDPRKTMLHLTPASKKFVGQIGVVKQDIYTVLKGSMSDAQLTLLTEWLEQFLENLQRQE